MPEVLICSDAEWLHEEVRSVLSAAGANSRSVYQGPAVLPAVQKELPDLVVLDFQVGNMGGMATCLELRLEETAGRLARVPVLMLLDRRADVFLARRADAQGWVVKPLDPLRLRKAVGELDAFTVSQFRQALAELASTPRLLIDMAGVPFVDSAGLGALIGGIRRSREMGGDVAVSCSRPTLTRLLRTTGFDRIVTVAETVEEAAAALLAEPSTPR